MRTAQCLQDQDLLPLAEGETAPPGAEEHLEHCRTCRQRLSKLRAEVEQVRDLMKGLDPRDVLAPESARRDERPAAIGRYVIVGVIDDRGGQAVVYRAVHPTLHKDLVIKYSRKPVSDAQPERHLLVEEGRLLARLDHPNIAKVYDLDFDRERPFLAMEYVRGRTLDAFAKQHAPDPARAARIIAKVARAVAVAHKEDVVHQDITPRNVLIDEDGEPRLIDFGMARIRQAWAEAPHEESTTGGTVAYMSPEQARRETARVGPRTDVFALGAVLYYLLTGKAPFSGSTFPEALDRAQQCDFDRDALDAAPRGLAAVCVKAMADEPEQRYESAEQLAGALERWANRPALLRKAATAAVLLLAIGGVSVWAYQHRTGPGAPQPGPVPAPMPAPVLAHNQEIVQIIRGGRPLALKAALPLKRGDRVDVSFEVPRGWHYAVVSVSRSFRFDPLNAKELPGREGMMRVIYPAAVLNAEAGTEILFVWAGPQPIPVETVEQAIRRRRPLPDLDPSVVVRMNRESVTLLAAGNPRDGGDGLSIGRTDAANPLSDVRFVLEQALQELRSAGAGFVAGVAFYHEGETPAAPGDGVGPTKP